MYGRTLYISMFYTFKFLFLFLIQQTNTNMSLKDQKAYPFDWIIPFLVAQLLNKNDKLEGTIEKKQAFIHLFDAKSPVF
mgnify:CR=1 FL=1